MAASRLANIRPGVFLLALAIAGLLWGIAQGRGDVERAFDVPVELQQLSEALVVTDQSVDRVNVRIMGSRAALRNVEIDEINYPIDVSGGKPGIAVYDVELSRIELPRGARFVAHSPSRVQVRFEKRARKAVPVRADLQGEPASGFRVVGLSIEPPEVLLAGARSQVTRLREVVTEPINITGIRETEQRQVRLFLGGGSVWMEENEPVKITVRVEANLEPEPEPVIDEGQETESTQPLAAQS